MATHSSTQRSLLTNTTYQTGLLGEYLVADLMRDRDYHVISHRARTRWGEIDLVMRKGDLIVFAEVKVASPGRVSPEQAVGAASQHRLRRAAVAWMATNASLQHGVHRYRFDVMIVRQDRDGSLIGIEHLRNAF